MRPCDRGVCVVAVNALFVDDANAPTRDSRVAAEGGRDRPGHVLNERRVLVGAHRDVALIGSLEERVDRRGTRAFGDLDQIAEVDMLTVRDQVEADFDFNCAALVVRAVVTDLATTWAKTRDGNACGERALRAGGPDCPSREQS